MREWPDQFSASETEQCEYVSVVWGNEKNPHPVFVRGEVGMAFWVQCISHDRVAIGNLFPFIQRCLGLASGLLVCF